MSGDQDSPEFEEIKDRNLEEKPLDPELAKEEAKKLAELEEKIDIRLRKYMKTLANNQRDLTKPGVIITNRVNTFRGHGDIALEWQNYPEREIDGLGNGTILYTHFVSFDGASEPIPDLCHLQ